MKYFSILFSIFLFIGCSNTDSNDDNQNDSNSIDISDLDGTFNLFPLALNPEFTSVSNINLDGNVKVGIVDFGAELRVYPYPYVAHNEIINDTYIATKYAFSYCPLTKSSLAFRRNGIFRASGYLYNDNMTPWDEETETIWSQMLISGIIGENKGMRLDAIPVLETTWQVVSQYYPNAKVLSPDVILTGRDVDLPEDNSDDINSPDSNDLVYGFFDDLNTLSIFKNDDFSENHVLQISLNSQDYIVYGDSSKGIITAFKVSSAQDFQFLENSFPYIIKNSAGIKYDILGRGTNGTKLEKPKYAYVAMWSAWVDFYDSFIFQE